MQTVQGVVSSNVKYAAYVEFGTRAHWAPLAPLVYWVRRKFGLKGDALFASAKGLQKKISVHGTKGQRYLQKAFDSNLAKIIHIFEKVADDAVK